MIPKKSRGSSPKPETFQTKTQNCARDRIFFVWVQVGFGLKSPATDSKVFSAHWIINWFFWSTWIRCIKILSPRLHSSAMFRYDWSKRSEICWYLSEYWSEVKDPVFEGCKVRSDTEFGLRTWKSPNKNTEFHNLIFIHSLNVIFYSTNDFLQKHLLLIFFSKGTKLQHELKHAKIYSM